MSRSYAPDASLARDDSQAWRPLAAVSSRSVDSHVNPSPIVDHSMPRCSASLRSPTFHFPLFTNCTTPTVQPRAQALPMTPNAEDDLPLPSPVLMRTKDGTRTEGAPPLASDSCASAASASAMSSS